MNTPYLDTLENLICPHWFHGQAPRPLSRHGRRHVWYGPILQWCAVQLERFGLQVCIKPKPHDWPEIADSMGQRSALKQIRDALLYVHEKGIPGNFVECGIWRGGACVYAKAVINELGSDREVIGCDSFEGLPPGDKHHTYSALAVSLEEVKQRAAKYRVGEIQYVKGFFKDSLYLIKDPIAVLRCDGDMYDSTMSIFEQLYPLVSPGGVIIVDDYQILECCREAVHDYLGFKPDVIRIGTDGPVQFLKTPPPAVKPELSMNENPRTVGQVVPDVVRGNSLVVGAQAQPGNGADHRGRRERRVDFGKVTKEDRL